MWSVQTSSTHRTAHKLVNCHIALYFNRTVIGFHNLCAILSVNDWTQIGPFASVRKKVTQGMRSLEGVSSSPFFLHPSVISVGNWAIRFCGEGSARDAFARRRACPTRKPEFIQLMRRICVLHVRIVINCMNVRTSRASRANRDSLQLRVLHVQMVIHCKKGAKFLHFICQTSLIPRSTPVCVPFVWKDIIWMNE